MQEEVKRYAERLRAEKGVNLQVRVGVNTGEVVVRSIRTDDAHTEYKSRARWQGGLEEAQSETG
jgi:class 3 adenylate cyclase